jgi:hypothetical protein
LGWVISSVRVSGSNTTAPARAGSA